MSTTLSWAMVFLAGGSLLLILACTAPAGASRDGSEEVAYLDSGVLGAALIGETAGGGQSQPSEPSLDAQEEITAYCVEDLTQDGYIDTGDIGAVTAHFAESYPALDIKAQEQRPDLILAGRDKEPS